MDGIKREIMFEKDWNQPCVHIDVPVPYEEDYQMKMLRYNEIDGLLRVSGIGREEESRYTYQTRGGISLEKKYENKNIEKETITAFIEQFMGVVEEMCIRDRERNKDKKRVQHHVRTARYEQACGAGP